MGAACERVLTKTCSDKNSPTKIEFSFGTGRE